MTRVVIVLPMPPSVNNLYAGQSRRYKSAGYKAWLLEAGHALNRQRPSKIAGKVSLIYEVQEPSTERRADVANREKATTDLLVDHGIIEGDDQFCVRDIHLKWSSKVDGIHITIIQH